MFNKFLLVTAMTLSLTAHAENWQAVQDGVGSDRLIVDVDSVAVDTYDKADNTKGTRIYATMQIVGGTETTPAFWTIIDVVECLAKGNGLLLTKTSDGTNHTYFWDTKGPRIYDAAGQWLCGYAQGLKELAAKNKSKDKKKITM